MATRSYNVAVTDTAVRVDPGDGASDNVAGYTINATNAGPGIVTYGPSTVADGVGDWLPVDARFHEKGLDRTDQIWAVCPSGETATLNVTVFGA